MPTVGTTTSEVGPCGISSVVAYPPVWQRLPRNPMTLHKHTCSAWLPGSCLSSCTDAMSRSGLVKKASNGSCGKSNFQREGCSARAPHAAADTAVPGWRMVERKRVATRKPCARLCVVWYAISAMYLVYCCTYEYRARVRFPNRFWEKKCTICSVCWWVDPCSRSFSSTFDYFLRSIFHVCRL